MNDELRGELHQDMKKMNDELRGEIHSLDEKYDKKFTNLENKVDDISRSVAVIEHDHGEKITILFDHFVGSVQKNKEYDSKHRIIEKKLDNYSARIANLEDIQK